MDKKQTGRKKKEEYYVSKKIDKVAIEENIIFLPINPEDYFHNPNIDMQINIISNTFNLEAYRSEDITYSKIKSEPKIEFVIPKPDYSDSTKEFYNLKIEPNILNTICCWWCCHPFDNKPVFLPTKLHREEYKVTGNFCSFGCCYSYMKNHRKHCCNLYLLNYMYKDITKEKGVLLDKIKPAPPRETLQMFGGMLDIKEFRKSDFIYTMNPYPMNSIPTQIEKKIIVKEQKFFKILPPSNVPKTKVELPQNSLGRILKIKQV